MILLITYDLHNPGRDYASVTEVIKTAASWAHLQGSVWLVDTERSPAEWRDSLGVAGDPNDEYFVSRLAHNWASRGIDQDIADWLKSPARNW